MKKSILFTILFFNCLYSFSQNELTFPLFENVYQSSYINPAHVPDHKISVGLPGISSIYIGATNTGFSYNKIFDRRDGNHHLKTNDIPFIIKKENYLYGSVNVDLFSLRIKIRHFFWSFNITEKVTSRFSYPRDLMKLAINGNQSFIGNEVNLSNSGFNSTHYREYGIGVVKQHRNFVYGARFKYLQGLSNIYYKSKSLGLKTGTFEENYAMELTADASAKTSGIPNYDDDLNENYLRKYLTNSKNPGLGIDLGFTYKLSKRIVLSAAINNVGFIRWTDKIKNYNVKGGSQFRGADIGKEILDNLDTNNAFEKVSNKYLDSLKNSFNYTETSEKYTTFLIPQLYLTGKYIITQKTQASLTFYLEKYILLRPALSLALYQEVGRWLNVAGSYSIQYGRFDNIGLGVVIKPPGTPIQFYICGDQLINKYTLPNGDFPAPLDSKAFNLRLGINLIFGSLKLHDKQPYPQKKKSIFK